MSKAKPAGLRRRWLMNMLGVISALSLVCVFAVTAFFAAYRYSSLKSMMYNRAENMAVYFSENVCLEREDAFQYYADYVDSFENWDDISLQLLDTQGIVAADSADGSVGLKPDTQDVADAIGSRGIETYVGSDNASHRRVMSVSFPVLDEAGEIVGVMRYVNPTAGADRQICLIALVSFSVLLVMVVAVQICSNYYLGGILSPLADITEKAKRIAGGSYGIQIQSRYRDEIGELAETINEMSAKISQNEKMQAEFISQLSHELRTPLTVINGWTETLLADESMDADTRQGMKIISSEAGRLTEMVMDLLDFTRMQDGRMTLAVELTDIRSEFEDTVFMYGSRLAQDGIKLEYLDNDEDIPEIPCDPQRLRQVFLNILDNAAKHGGEGKRIEASIHHAQDTVLICIRDFGPGIPEDELPLVKKKFYKGSSSVRGTGIGLAVCEEIVDMHGGTLTLENAEGGGTLVTVQLPARS